MRLLEYFHSQVCGACGGMADAGDLKSPVRKDVRVRVPPRPVATI